MKLSEFEEHLMTGEMSVGARADAHLSLTWDANKFTGEVGRRMARVYRECAARVEAGQKPQAQLKRKTEDRSLVKAADEFAASMELTAALAEIDAQMYAEVLACDRYGILHAWGMEDDEGRVVEPTFEILSRQRADVLKAIFVFCRESSLPKKPEAGSQPSPETSQTTSSTINDGSSPLTTPAQDDPTTLQTST